jgi:hypothetical protein
MTSSTTPVRLTHLWQAHQNRDEDTPARGNSFAVTAKSE